MSTYQILSGSDSLAYKNITEEEAGFIIFKLSWALNEVSVINSPAPNTSGATLSIDKNGYSSNPIVFALSGDDLTIKKSSAATVNLNSDRAVVTNLNFDFIRKTGSSTADSIRASFTVNGKNFETTKFIR